MSDQSKYYDYYMVEGDDVKELISSYDTINEQRNSILLAAAEQVGAIAWT
ncbi:TPA: Eac protein, partial [Salmonella enterica subsp. enterica serovar Eastbourne]